jgi:GcrA cell cycle regulator
LLAGAWAQKSHVAKRSSFALDPLRSRPARSLTSINEAKAMSTTSLTWSSDRVEQLKRCFQAGLTCSQIAREIGVTRNAVIGKMNRMGLSRPRDLLGAQMRRAAKLGQPKPQKTWRRLNVIAQRKMLREAFPQARVESVPIRDGRGCTLLELKSGQCRWPINDPGSASFCFCGNEAFTGLPYCGGHARLAYRSARSA